MIVVWLLVGALATWRLASLISRERGLIAVGTRLRSLVGVYHALDGTPAFDEDSGEVLLNPVTPWASVDAVLHEFAHGMTCIWCASVWCGALVALLLAHVEPLLVYDFASFALVALGLSAGALVIERIVRR